MRSMIFLSLRRRVGSWSLLAKSVPLNPSEPKTFATFVAALERRLLATVELSRELNRELKRESEWRSECELREADCRSGELPADCTFLLVVERYEPASGANLTLLWLLRLSLSAKAESVGSSARTPKADIFRSRPTIISRSIASSGVADKKPVR